MSFDAGAEARALLTRNWREGEYRGRRYAFSVPSPRSYPWQWYWDSCFHAIVRRRFDPAGARAELETLLNASREDGFIGHTVLWGHPLDAQRAIRYNIASRADLMTSTIQPPLLAWAWAWVAGAPAAFDPRIERHHAWLREHRALEADGLLWLIQPDESGMDASPKFDHVWGRVAQGRPLFPMLIARNRRLGFDARRVRAAGHPVVCEVLTNVAWSLSEQALGRESLTGALVERLWDEKRGRFADDVVNAVRPTPPEARPRTWDTLAPLALPDLPDAIAQRLVDEVLRAPGFSGAVPLPAVALDDPSYSSRETWWGRHRHWRGPSWVNSAWFVSLGLRRLGLDAEADALAARLHAVVAREGFREYYEARLGYGMGAHDFGWSTLLWELTDPVEPPTLAR
ncbi:MGH1-like glycoside hydrolase domain-containing protein [Baekduia sp. Peel2402]|uniref:MGH1-like glycoside hydrolase domain-containing protein n=1 Tax=Baekduia sp. Peel2402 TaxID=3458296 RepID=UPI00403E450A